MSVLGGAGTDYVDTFTVGYCAAHALCLLKGSDRPAALLLDERCPGCGEAVHLECGYLNPEAPNEVDGITCLLCFDKFGRPLSGSSDPDFLPRAPPPINSQHNTRSARPTGKPASTKKKAPPPPRPVRSEKRKKQLEDIEERRVARLEAREEAIDDNNPDYMYPDSDTDDDDEDDDDDWSLAEDGNQKEDHQMNAYLAETPVK